MPEPVTLKDPFNEKRLYRSRIVLAALLMLLLTGVVVWRYFSLQIIEHEKYSTQSERNRVQLQPVAPRRGLIYDSKGVLLAENRASYNLTVVKERVDNLDQTLTLLKELLSIDDEQVNKFNRLLTRRRPYAAVPLKHKLTEQEIAIVSVNRYRLPGVEVKAELTRHYTHGELFAHVLGYMGRINEAEQQTIDEVNYSATNDIGKIGLEKYYEETLHGKVGYQNVETNARGRVLRVLERIDPQPGADLHLHLDIDIQRAAHEALGDNRGAVVAIDPLSGGVLALVSKPSFDANQFIGGISRRNYAALRDSPDLPMFNRALQGQYPPGSTVKPFFGLAGLYHDVITSRTAIADPGWYQLPNDERLYRDWTWKLRRAGHGQWVRLNQALAESCDTYFWDLAYKLGIDRIHKFSRPFGFGEPVGIDSTNERSGLLPSRQWKRNAKRRSWFPGETLNVGIGQGYMLATPLQLAKATTVIANRGHHFTPQLVRAIGDDQLFAARLQPIELQSQHWDAVIEGMQQVVHGSNGSANSIAQGAAYRMAGKTGTAQVISIAQDEEYDAEQIAIRQRDHALFVGFAPVEQPQIVVAAIIENGEKSSYAAEVVRRVFDAYLRNRPAPPQPAPQTSPRQQLEDPGSEPPALISTPDPSTLAGFYQPAYGDRHER